MKSRFLYLSSNGEFGIKDPELVNGLYFPLVNESGMMSCVTPLLGGDSKTGQNAFSLPPESIYELHNNRSSRNFWLYFGDSQERWSATGVSASQLENQLGEQKESTSLEAGLLWHRVTRNHRHRGLVSEITTFVPTEDETVELTKVVIRNTGEKAVAFKPYTAIPLFGRSADNLRDHRQVTSLLNRCEVLKQGIVLKPVLSFNERGHEENHTSYGVFCVSEDDGFPIGACPAVDEFIGNGGTFETPMSLGTELGCHSGDHVDGKEIIAALQMPDTVLQPGESKSYVFGICIFSENQSFQQICDKYAHVTAFDDGLKKNRAYWNDLLALTFESGDAYKDGWMKWVSVQPVLRRIFGCSFLPHYDYGRGGRGWRDLWQDCLSLLLMKPENVRGNMINFFAGVRTDGSNATIIGEHPGEFVVDRNGVVRVWMDHAAWPLFTVMLYILQTNDLSILLEKQIYFRDKRTHRGKIINFDWKPEDGQWLKRSNGEYYYGTILEHLLVENLTAVYSVGEHNILRLEGGDWNDGLDMAPNRGESVAFSCFYYYNLLKLSELCHRLYDGGERKLKVSKALLILIESRAESREDKAKTFESYLDVCDREFCSETICIDPIRLADALEEKAKLLYQLINRQEWISDSKGNAWYNSYYDDLGRRVEGVLSGDVRMMLTGQVYAIMSGLADDGRVSSIIKAADRYLYTENGGYRLNTDFKEHNFHLGRMFCFAYGTKENGAVFSHMAVMYAYALYSRGYVSEGYRVIDALYQGSRKFDVSCIYPGIPEYFEPDGHGNYPYLTGSASWLIFVMLTQVYGVRGNYGNLLIEPKLMNQQFDHNGNTTVHFQFCGRKFCVVYHNICFKEYSEYQISCVTLDGISIIIGESGRNCEIPINTLKELDQHMEHLIDITLE